nr:hypothetical protein [uncultured Flavobacterium sp.]
MQRLLNRVKSNVNICGLEISFNGEAVASGIENWQEFYNTITTDAEFFKLVINIAAIEFNEVSKESNAGTSYQQTVKFTVRNGDQYRAERMALFKNIKFLKVVLSNNSQILIGRNDYYQKAKPKVKIEANAQLFECTLQNTSIFPSGYTPTLPLNFGLPAQLPLTLNF